MQWNGPTTVNKNNGEFVFTWWKQSTSPVNSVQLESVEVMERHVWTLVRCDGGSEHFFIKINSNDLLGNGSKECRSLAVRRTHFKHDVGRFDMDVGKLAVLLSRWNADEWIASTICLVVTYHVKVCWVVLGGVGWC